MTEKNNALAHLQSFLYQICCPMVIVPQIANVADELLMNGLFSAPHDSDGRAKYATRDRREPHSVEEAERVQMRFGCDGRNIALSVTDSFGRLDRATIIAYLESCFLGKLTEVDQTRASAGLGLKLIFNSVTQLVFNIEPNVRTEVIALFYVRGGPRGFRQSGRSFNVFSTGHP